jgi:hypothetical protein
MTMPAFLKSRTMMFALALAVFGVLEVSMGALRAVLLPLLGEAAFGLFTVGVSIVVAVLRVVTTQPINEK